MNQNNIKKEKYELKLLSSNLAPKGCIIKQSSNVQRPDSLDIKVNSGDNVVNIVKHTDAYQENISSWNSDNLDNFILQIRNANNTPSPITPTSFFNPSDVTQDQEQFADALTLHLNKIKEDYKSSIETTTEPYLNNIIQISSLNQEKPISISTVSLGNKVYLVNQIGHNLHSNESQVVNYGVMGLANNLSSNNNNQNTFIHQPLKIPQFQTLRSSLTRPTILCSDQNVKVDNVQSYTRGRAGEMVEIFAANNDQNLNFIKSSEGIIYTRVPESSNVELFNQLTTITNTNANIGRVNPYIIKANFDRDCLSASSNDNDISYAINDNSIKVEKNSSRLSSKDDKDMDDVQRRLERKRAKNREAARKCRDRKNTLIATLEEKYTKQAAEKEMIREKLLKSLDEIRRLTEYISKHDPHSTFGNFSNFLNEIKVEELTGNDLKDLNLL